MNEQPFPTRRLGRRRFLIHSTLATVGIAMPWIARAQASANAKVVLGCIGVSRTSTDLTKPGRGTSLATGLAGLKNVEIAAVCDVDEMYVRAAADDVEKVQGKRPEMIRDLRKLLENRAIDGVTIATPDHWHAPAAILACAAGKHVYVEKPCCHNGREGELMLAAARKHTRVMQHGTQRRSWPGQIEAVQRVRAGELGNVHLSRAWMTAKRPSIGRGKRVPVPAGLDYELWQGPAPRRPYRDNIVPYHWHWFWHWGTGELGNHGIHTLDVARWGMGVDYPTRVVSSGGRYFHDDDQETPDTQFVTFEYGKKIIQWEHRSCQPHGLEGVGSGIVFYGDRATLVIEGGGYKIFDLNRKEIGKGSGSGGDKEHLQNYVDAIRDGKALNADIEEGVKSTLMCHLGNAALRTGETVRFDPATKRIVGAAAATALWKRDYEPGWEPKL
jgi:predicted dehydrogenase